MSIGSGLVETLWAGFATVNRRPAILFVPVVIDLLVWLGPRVTARPVAAVAAEEVQRWLAGIASDPSLGQSAEQARLVGEGLPRQIGTLGEANLIGLVGWLLPGVVGVDQQLGQVVWELAGVPLAAFLAGLFAIGVVLAAFFYQLVAQAVRDEPLSVGTALRRLPRFVLRQFAWIGMLMVATVVVGTPLILFVSLVAVLSQVLALGLVMAIWTVGLIAAWWLFFHTSAMYVSDIGPVRALIASVEVVTRNRGASLLMVAIVWLVSTGWALVWRGVEGLPAGGLLSILGTTYVSCGLLAATMIFYRDRAASRVPVAHAGQQPA